MKTCETKQSNNKVCGRNAIAKITCKFGKKDCFYVCRKCLPAYQYLPFKKYGQKEDTHFKIKLLKGSHKN